MVSFEFIPERTPLTSTSNLSIASAHASEALVGFSESKAFYTPKYSSYASELFSNYGTIGWFPNVYLNNHKSEILKVLDTKTTKLKFFIEGYDSNGNLVSQIKTIDTTGLDN